MKMDGRSRQSGGGGASGPGNGGGPGASPMVSVPIVLYLISRFTLTLVHVASIT